MLLMVNGRNSTNKYVKYEIIKTWQTCSKNRAFFQKKLKMHSDLFKDDNKRFIINVFDHEIVRVYYTIII